MGNSSRSRLKMKGDNVRSIAYCLGILTLDESGTRVLDLMTVGQEGEDEHGSNSMIPILC